MIVLIHEEGDCDQLLAVWRSLDLLHQRTKRRCRVTPKSQILDETEARRGSGICEECEFEGDCVGMSVPCTKV
jgi:hypothetical protein